MIERVNQYATLDGRRVKGGRRVVVVDSAECYRLVLAELRSKGITTVDQYALETAFQIAKMDIQRACGFAVEIRFSRSEAHQLHRHDAGRGIALATKGLEARAVYRELRGALPRDTGSN